MTPDTASPDGLLLGITAITVLTVFLRFVGYWLMGFVQLTPRVYGLLDALPGPVIVAVVLPLAIKGGPIAIGAVASAMFAMWLWRNDFIAVFTGLAVAAGAR